MASHEDSSPERVCDLAAEFPLKRVAPTLYAIIFFKLVKGILFLFFGFVLYFQAARNLPQEYADLLKKPIFQNLRIHPENKLVQHIAEQIADLTQERIKWSAVLTMLWSLFPLSEGTGLLFRASWAGWLAICESAFFVPIVVLAGAHDREHPHRLVSLRLSRATVPPPPRPSSSLITQCHAR
jgi:uncharacterized membrane protein (DUF2068 family)